MELDYQAIGIRIRRLRKAQRLTQQALAEISNQEPSNISHIERGATKLSLPTIVNIANALGVTVDELLCDSLIESKAIFEREATDILSDCTVVSRVMRKIGSGIWQKSITGGRLDRPLVTIQRAGRKASRAAVRRLSCP